MPEDVAHKVWLELFAVNLFIVFSEQNMVLWFPKVNEIADERYGATVITDRKSVV